jgi:predicted membrane protein
MKRFYFLVTIFIVLFFLTGCISAVVIVEWGHLRIKDQAQIKADKAECEEKAKCILATELSEIKEQNRGTIKISALDRIF